MSEKIDFKPGNMLYPLPAVMVSCGSGGQANILTVAWAGTVCSDPPMVSISVRPERHSWPLIKESGEFVINLVTEDLVRAADYCGVRSGRDVDKWKDCGLTKTTSKTVACPGIAESPVNIECKVKTVQELGSHTMFTAEVTAVRADARYMTEKGSFRLNDSGLVTYSHGTYFALGEALGTFGFSVKKEAARSGTDGEAKMAEPQRKQTGKKPEEVKERDGRGPKITEKKAGQKRTETKEKAAQKPAGTKKTTDRDRKRTHQPQ